MNTLVIILIVCLVIIYISYNICFYDSNTKNSKNSKNNDIVSSIDNNIKYSIDTNIKPNMETNMETNMNLDSNIEKIKLYVFLSNNCPHCHTYLDNHHNDIDTLIKSKNIDIQIVKSDGSNESNLLFNKYNIQYIPSAVFTKNDIVYKNLGSDITTQTVKQALENY
jgi:hypothetical protein